jgi:hypothetical protein
MDETAEEYEQLIEVGVDGRHTLGTQGHVERQESRALASSLWQRALRMTTKIQQSGTKVRPTARQINIHVRRLPQTARNTVDDAPLRATTEDQLNVENNLFLAESRRTHTCGDECR